MKRAALLLALVAPFAVSAQGFSDHTTCYSWNGGNHSSGSFIQCDTYKVAEKRSAPLPAPVVQSPVMMPMAAPVTCAPPPKPVVTKRKHKPLPKC
jgi:hypothetical protein